MKEHLKNFGKGVLLGLLLNLLLSSIFTIIAYFEKPWSVSTFGISFFTGSFQVLLVLSSLGLLLYGAIYVIYHKLGGKKPVQVFSLTIILIVIYNLSSYFLLLLNNESNIYESRLFALAILLFIILSIFLIKVTKENMPVTISTLIWFIILITYYSIFAFFALLGLEPGLHS